MIKTFLKEYFYLWCKNRWLKIIDKEVTKMNSYCDSWKRQKIIVDRLIDEYNKRYPDSKIAQQIHK